MRKGRNRRGLKANRRRWQHHGQTQGTVHRAMAGCGAVIAIHIHDFENACAGTDPLGGFGCHQRRRHGHTQRQSKPHQHEAGEVAQLSKGLHGWNCKQQAVQPNCGGRLALSEATPSRTSGPPKPMNSKAKEVSNAGPAWRSQLFKAYLVQRMALWLPLASLSATS